MTKTEESASARPHVKQQLGFAAAVLSYEKYTELPAPLRARQRCLGLSKDLQESPNTLQEPTNLPEAASQRYAVTDN